MAKGPSMFGDLPSFDPAKAAREHLNELIQDGSADEDVIILDKKIRERELLKETASEEEEKVEEEFPEATLPVVPVILAAEARRAAPILESQSTRNSIRLLILTKDTTITEDGSLSQKRILELGELFAEVHTIVLNQKDGEKISSVRVAENVWLYSTNSTYWWTTMFDAYHIVKEQLVFGGGFRADIVLAEDPFESGAAGWYIAHTYKRPFQVHVLEDFYDPSFKEANDYNGLRAILAHFVLKRTDCVRTNSTYLRDEIVAEHRRLKEYTEILPTYYNLSAWCEMPPAFNLKERYPQFKFLILNVSAMHARSHTAEVINGTSRMLLRYPTIGLVIVGSGPLRAALEKQVIMLGIQNQVEFEPMPGEVISHMKSANILLHLSEDPEEDYIVLEAAAVKLPIIASTSNIAGTLFRDGESALMCENIDAMCVQEKINKYLNENQARAQFSLNAQEIVFERIEQDYAAYLEAYRSSIERGIA